MNRSPIVRGLTCALLSIAIIPGCSAITKDPTPHQAVVINPQQFWKTSLCGVRPVAEVVTLDLSGRNPRFIVLDAMQRHIWLNRMAMHFSRNDYPIAVIRYRARNIHKKDYLIWMNDDTGRGQTGLATFSTNDLILDGQEHELCQDLRKQKREGNVTSIWLAVHCGPEAPAEFELIDLRFERDPEAHDPAITIRVVDPGHKPIAGAEVMVDAEFRNWARSGVTDAQGNVTVTPLPRPAGNHMVRISKPGMVTIELRNDMQRNVMLPAEVVLPKATVYGGTVVDEAGMPIANVAVHLSSAYGGDDDSHEANPPQAKRRVFLPVKVLTDEQGRWRSPALPHDLKRLKVRMAHTDYVCDPLRTFYSHATEPLDMKLRDHSAVRVLKRGLTIGGMVTDEQGQPLSGVTVKLDSPHWKPNVPEVTTDATGGFTFKHHPQSRARLTACKSGYITSSQAVDLQKEMIDLHFRLKPSSQ